MEKPNDINAKPGDGADYKLSAEDLAKINDDVTELHETFEQIWDKEWAPINITVVSSELHALNNYQQFLVEEFPKKFDDEFSIQQIIDPTYKTLELSVQMSYSLGDDAKVAEVAKFIFETAKSRGCNYSGVNLDAVFPDDPRVQHNADW